MNSIKFFLSLLLLIFSDQSLALFMPEGGQINTDETAVFNDVGC